MSELLKSTNVRQFLTAEFQARREKNRAYTMRAFARDVAISSSQLSRVMRGQAGLSRSSAEVISRQLNLDKKTETYFFNLVDLEYSRSKLGRDAAKEKVLQTKTAFTPLDRSAFKAISQWYYLPLICLTELEDFKEDQKWIAKRLKIKPELVKPAIELLLKVGMLKRNENGQLQPTGEYFTNVNGLPSEAVRLFHRQSLEKAIASIEEQNTKERYLSSLVLTVDDEQITEAQLFVKKFLDEFKIKFANEYTQKKQVYALNLQYFSLTNLLED